MSEGFFERWSRRKQQVREGEVPEEAVVPPEAAAVAEAARPHPNPPPEGEGETPPSPTLADTEALNPESDFKPFLASNVAPEVKNAALKKLFADPHFNVMDGLDTYIDDYGKPDPIPPDMLRKMTQSAMLGLFDEEPAPPEPASTADDEVAPTAASPDGEAPEPVAQSTLPAPLPHPGTDPVSDDDPDLRLQQDEGTGRSGAAPEPGL
jgi:hypothetical protein